MNLFYLRMTITGIYRHWTIIKKTARIGVFILFGYSQAYPQEARLKQILAEANVSGIQLVYQKNDKYLQYNMGVIQDSSVKKISSKSIFQAASLSKTVFAYAILRLYDRGIIDLDKPLLDYYGAHYARFDPTNPDYGLITARMVLRHTTGLPNWGNDSVAKLLFKPDSCFSYSGEGYLFLQRVIEKMLGKPLNEIMVEEVFLPLGMRYSSYVWKPAFDSIATMPHQTADEVKRYEQANAAYSLLTNAHDFNIFLRALMSGKGLRPATHQLMLAKSSEANRYKEPQSPADPYIDWGLGLGLQKNQKGNAVWHWGDNGEYKCFYLAYPSRHESLVYFTHSNNGLFITNDLLQLFYGPDEYWATRWLDYGFEAPSLVKSFKASLDKQGYDKAPEVLKKMRQKDTTHALSEHDLNLLGYILLRKQKQKEALEIFKLNVSLYPSSSNVYDSLGEAYDAMGQRTLALENYKHSIALDPDNGHAAERIKKLEAN